MCCICPFDKALLTLSSYKVPFFLFKKQWKVVGGRALANKSQPDKREQSVSNETMRTKVPHPEKPKTFNLLILNGCKLNKLIEYPAQCEALVPQTLNRIFHKSRLKFCILKKNNKL